MPLQQKALNKLLKDLLAYREEQGWAEKDIEKLKGKASEEELAWLKARQEAALIVGQWYVYTAKMRGSDYKVYLDDVLIQELTDDNFLGDEYKIGLDSYGTTVQFDKVRVRKYVLPEPTGGVSGEEEEYCD